MRVATGIKVYYCIYLIEKNGVLNVLIRLLLGRLGHSLLLEAEDPQSPFFREFLPSTYLRRSKFKNYQPSPSVYAKILKFRPVKLCTEDTSYGIKSRLLVVRTGAMGDVILSTPIVAALHAARGSNCAIYVATNFPEVFQGSPYVLYSAPLRVIQKLKLHFTQIIDLDFTYEQDPYRHPTDAYALIALGKRVSSDTPEIFAQPVFRVEKMFKKLDIPRNLNYIIVHNRFSMKQPFRGVRPPLWETLLGRLRDITGAAIIQIGDPVLDAHVEAPGFFDMRGQCSLGDTKQLLQASRGFVGVDAGPLHIAACTTVPIAAFFTHVPAEVRAPRRSPDQRFVEIKADIDCYGCSTTFPSPWGFYCRRGDSLCSNSYNLEMAITRIVEMLLPAAGSELHRL